MTAPVSDPSHTLTIMGMSGRRRGPELVTALAVYVVVRVIGIVVLVARAHQLGLDPLARMTRDDGQWYLGIAAHGYDASIVFRPDGTPVNTNVAFFPAYPALIRLFSSLPWVEPRGAAFLVTALAGLAAAAGIFLIARDLIGARAALVVLALWASWPHGVVLSMAYSEALFTAFAAWSLLA